MLTTGDDILPGTIATVTATSGCTAIMIYPDTLVNLQTSTIQAVPLYDMIIYACGKFGLSYFDRLGARRSAYLPFGWDDHVHPRPNATDQQEVNRGFDVVFVGNWRRDREDWLEHLDSVSVGIWGTAYWRRRTRPGSVSRRSWQGAVALGSDYARASRAGKITLNLVDTLNGPGLNMRAFEAVGMGCFVLTTRTQALEELFIEGEHVAYFDNSAELQEKVRHYLDRPGERERIASNAARFADSNTYRHRAEQLLRLLRGL
jgi:spore maturation protein CgeB